MVLIDEIAKGSIGLADDLSVAHAGTSRREALSIPEQLTVSVEGADRAPSSPLARSPCRRAST
jgi:hypothetical protein